MGINQYFTGNSFTEDIIQIKCVHYLPDAMGYTISKNKKPPLDQQLLA